jgi:hypothetical protein
LYFCSDSTTGTSLSHDAVKCILYCISSIITTPLTQELKVFVVDVANDAWRHIV